MKTVNINEFLLERPLEITLEHLFSNLKVNSGGEQDTHFLKYLIDHQLLNLHEAVLKRTTVGTPEEYYLERYKKMSLESDRHYYCRAVIQEEFARRGISSMSSMNVGNMSLLRANSCYDIVTDDLSILVDVGLTPARNFFRGLTDTRTKVFLVTAFFDEYMDDIIFASFTRNKEKEFLDAVHRHEKGMIAYSETDGHAPVIEKLDY